MEKKIKIDGKDVLFKTSGAFAKRYKAQFKRDAIADIFTLSKVFSDANNDISSLADLNSEIMFDLCWSLARNADPNIPAPEEWLDTFDVFPVVDVMPEIIDLLMVSLSTSVKPKKK